MCRVTLEMTGTEEVKTCFRIGGRIGRRVVVVFWKKRYEVEKKTRTWAKGAWRCLCYGLGLARLWVPARKCKASLDVARKA